ncbi:MAG: DUF6338 family protein [Chloroflexota bacterium]|nr:DUF6338 family protein [Chloroflexota bacterium]
MAELLDQDTLVLFLVFVVPGFVAIKFYDLIVPSERRNFGESMIEIVSYSMINLGVSGWLVPVGQRYFENLYFPLLYFVIFIAPCLLALGAVHIRRLPVLRYGPCMLDLIPSEVRG